MSATITHKGGPIGRVGIGEITTDTTTGVADRILALLEDFGVAVVPDWLAVDAVAALRSEQDYLWKHEVPGIDMDHPAKGGRVIRLRRERLDADVMPATVEAFAHPLMEEVSRRYLKNPFILNREIFVTDHGPDDTPILPLHNDQLQCLKFYIYLADTTEQDGAFSAVPGSHRLARAIREFHLSRGMPTLDLPNRAVPDAMPAPTPITGEAGTLIVFDTDAYHMGGTVADGHRRRVMRGHTRALPLEIHNAKPLTRQWWREHPLNPMTGLRRSLDRIRGTEPPGAA